MKCKKCKTDIPDTCIYCPLCGKKQIHTESVSKSRKRGNGMGTVYKISGKRARPWVAAKNKIVIGYYSTKTEAMAAIDGFQGKELPDWYNIKLDTIYEKWKEDAFPSLSEKSQKMYECSWKKLYCLKDKRIRDIRTSDYQEIIDSLSGKSYSLKNQVRVLCSQLCKFAIVNDVITRNYAQGLKIGKNVKKEKKIFSQQDRNKLNNAAITDKTAQIVMILIYTGMRINELFNVKKTDVHLEGNTPYLIGGEKTEAGKNRMIPIALPILTYIKKFMQAPGNYLICNSNGERKDYQNFREREYYPLLERLEIPRVTIHSTRHTFASMMVKAGARPEDLQKIIGHADYKITANIYNHADAEQLTEAIRMLK